jgi:hypothetical protein
MQPEHSIHLLFICALNDWPEGCLKPLHPDVYRWALAVLPPSLLTQCCQQQAL